MGFAKLGLAVGALLLALMAGLQLNDPDPIYWVTTYLLASAATLCTLLSKPVVWLPPLAAGLVLAGLLISGGGFIDYIHSGDYQALLGAMSERKPYVESAREFIGLLITALILWPSWGYTNRAQT